MEYWVDVKGYNGVYRISTEGNIMSLKRGSPKILKPVDNGKGYGQVRLFKNNKGKFFKVHQLMAITFLNHKPCGMELVVDHINHNCKDNRIVNLQIISNRLNISKDKRGSSRYTGVSWNKRCSKWESQIRINGKRKFLGYYDNELDASNKYQEYLLLL